ncbi:MAG TPA: 50S ribosomal protein L11 methyltransferase [Ilumatobacteraceae bacterium]|nr:50S ribosomal protein L11 methyltransferase [Ilumatobacteraceae bacterium]
MRAFVVTVPEADVDIASDALWQLGVRAIEERSSPRLAEVVELWTAVGDDDTAIERAGTAMGQRWPWRVEAVADGPADTWRDYARPMWVDERLVIVPAWHEHAFDEHVVVVSIEPGGAFGLGDHPTTLLSLQAIRPLIESTTEMLDVGCGTGVLAVTAAVLGARAVRAVDIASAAVEATTDNARRNAVERTIGVDTAPAQDLERSYDLVVANILAPTLIELADDLRRLTRPDGRLVISGILAERHGHVLGALAPMIVQRVDTLDGWVAITLRHP